MGSFHCRQTLINAVWSWVMWGCYLCITLWLVGGGRVARNVVGVSGTVAILSHISTGVILPPALLLGVHWIAAAWHQHGTIMVFQSMISWLFVVIFHVLFNVRLIKLFLEKSKTVYTVYPCSCNIAFLLLHAVSRLAGSPFLWGKQEEEVNEFNGTYSLLDVYRIAALEKHFIQGKPSSFLSDSDQMHKQTQLSAFHRKLLWYCYIVKQINKWVPVPQRLTT